MQSSAILRHILGRSRLIGALAFGLVLYFLFPGNFDQATRALIAWNVAIVVFLVLAGHVMATATDEHMRERALMVDEGRFAVLGLSLLAATTTLVAIVIELAKAKAGTDVVLHIGLSVTTILTSWSFIHVIFTEHYAHEFYIERGEDGRRSAADGHGLNFPGEKRPDYLDFLYFTFTIAVANQTADVSIASRRMRMLVLVHSVISYFFNTIILALSINIASSLMAQMP